MSSLWRGIERLADQGWPGWGMLAVGALIAALFLLFVWMLIYSVIDHRKARHRWDKDVVKDRHYGGARTSMGVGPAIGGSGGLAVTVSYTPEEYWLEFKRIGLRKVSRESFSKVSVGDQVWVGTWVGGLSNSALQTTVERYK